jgi:hypothetical protein
MALTQFPGRPSVQTSAANEAAHREQIARSLNSAMRGYINCTLLLTLDPGVASTQIIDSRISFQTFVGMMPTTPNAAAEVASGNLYVVTEAGLATVFHTNNAQTDRIFTITVVG